MNRVVTALMLMMLFMGLVSFMSSSAEYQGDIKVINVLWKSSVGTENVYPGSKQAQLIIELYNGFNVAIRSVSGCLILPKGFTPSMGSGTCSNAVSPNGTYISEIEPGQVFQLRYRLDVSENVTPREYVIGVNVTYVAVYEHDSTLVKEPGYVIKYVIVTIKPYPPLKIEIKDVYWDTEKVYPGTRNAVLNVMVYNGGDSSITNAHVRLLMPEGFTPSTIRLDVGAIGSRSTYTLRFTDIEVSPSLSPGQYSGILRINATTETEDGVSYETSWEGEIVFIVSEAPKPNIEVIDVGWVNRVVYNSSRLGDLYVTLQNKDMDTLEKIVATLNLPSGITGVGGEFRLTTVYENPVNYGDVFTLVFNDLNVTLDKRNIIATLELEVLGSDHGAEYWSKLSYVIGIKTSLQEEYLKLVRIQWYYQGTPAIPLPSSNDIVLEVRLLNIGPESIETLVPEIKLPEGFKIKSISPDSYTGIQPGGTTTIDIVIDIDDDVKPGAYPAKFVFDIIVSSGDSISYLRQEINSTIYIGNPSEYASKIITLSYFWGSGNPGPVYPGQREASITLQLYNAGRYPVNDAIASLKPLNDTVKSIVDTVFVGDMPSGSTSMLVFTYDLENVTSGKLVFNLTVTYTIRVYGAFIRYNDSQILTIDLEEFAGYRGYGIEVADFGWTNSPVFPGTENATYSIVIVNRLPFSIGGITARLALPEGFYIPKGYSNEAYVPGPIQSMQQATLSFTISIGKVKPGIYRGYVELNYIVYSGGTGSSRHEVHPIDFIVNNIDESIVFVTAYWLYQSPDVGSRGANLAIVLQNTYIPEMKGIKASVKLPSGIVYSYTNTSIAVITPSYVGQQMPISVPTMQQAVPRQLQELAKLLTQSSTVTAPIGEYTASRGDYIVFNIPLSVIGLEPGVYNITMNIEFIDHLDNQRNLTIVLPLYLLGGISYISVEANNTFTLHGFNNTLDITLVNHGSGDAYNVYLILYPYIPMVIPGESIYYIEKIPSSSSVHLSIPLYYNPLYTASYPTIIRFGTIPLVLTLIYRDPMGYQHVFNTSISIVIEPFIELIIGDIKAEQVGGTIKVSGTITNMGSAVAERVKLKLVVGDRAAETFIGDIDPGSETSFSIELENYPGIAEKGRLILSYYDIYEKYHEKSITIDIRYVEITTTTTPPPEIVPSKNIIIFAVALFLVMALLLIYRLVKQHEARLRG